MKNKIKRNQRKVKRRRNNMTTTLEEIECIYHFKKEKPNSEYELDCSKCCGYNKKCDARGIYKSRMGNEVSKLRYKNK